MGRQGPVCTVRFGPQRTTCARLSSRTCCASKYSCCKDVSWPSVLSYETAALIWEQSKKRGRAHTGNVSQVDATI